MHELTFRLKRAHLRSVELGKRLCGVFALTPARFDVLYVVRSLGGSCSQSEITRALGVAKQTISRMVGRMQELGLLLRETGAGDGRGRRVVLTKAGFEAVASAAAYFFRGNALRDFLDTMHRDGREFVERATSCALHVARELADSSSLAYPTERPPLATLEENNYANVHLHGILCARAEAEAEAQAQATDGGATDGAPARPRGATEHWGSFAPPRRIYGPLVHTLEDAWRRVAARIESRRDLSPAELRAELVRASKELDDDWYEDFVQQPSTDTNPTDTSPSDARPTDAKSTETNPTSTRPDETNAESFAFEVPLADAPTLAVPAGLAAPRGPRPPVPALGDMAQLLGNALPAWMTGRPWTRPPDGAANESGPEEAAKSTKSATSLPKPAAPPKPLLPLANSTTADEQPPSKAERRAARRRQRRAERRITSIERSVAPDVASAPGVASEPGRASGPGVASAAGPAPASPDAGEAQFRTWWERPLPLPKLDEYPEFDADLTEEELNALPKWFRDVRANLKIS